METITLDNGTTVEIDDTPYYISDGTLYVYCDVGNGFRYLAMGKVERHEDKN